MKPNSYHLGLWMRRNGPSWAKDIRTALPASIDSQISAKSGERKGKRDADLYLLCLLRQNCERANKPLAGECLRIAKDGETKERRAFFARIAKRLARARKDLKPRPLAP